MSAAAITGRRWRGPTRSASRMRSRAHLFGHEGDASGSEALARYVQAAAALLADESCEGLLAGRIAFPSPDTIAEDAR